MNEKIETTSAFLKDKADREAMERLLVREVAKERARRLTQPTALPPHANR